MPSTRELEQTAESQRAQLTERLDTIASKAQPKANAQRAVGQSEDLGQTLIHTLMKGAKQNPSGLAIMGMGAVMIALSSQKQTNQSSLPSNETRGQDDRIASADAKIKARNQVMTGRFAAGQVSASTLRKSLDKGLDKLSPEARARVTEARLKVIDAQEDIERRARRASEKARETHYSQPFLTGAMVAGVGALVGALLPATRTEADMMGATRDKLMRDAEATLHAELSKLEEQGKAAVESGIEAARSEFTDGKSTAR